MFMASGARAAVFGQQAAAGELGAQLLHVAHRGGNLDLRQRGGGITTLYQAGNFDGP